MHDIFLTTSGFGFGRCLLFAHDTNVMLVLTVMNAPIVVRAVMERRFASHALHVVKPDRPISLAVDGGPCRFVRARKTELFAYDSRVSRVPPVTAHCPPLSVVEDL